MKKGINIYDCNKQLFDLTNVQYVKENIFIGITLEQLVVQGGPKNKVKIIVGPLKSKILTKC